MGSQGVSVGRVEVVAVAMNGGLTCTNVLVGVTGFEPAASSSRTKRATKLRHTPSLRTLDAGQPGAAATDTVSDGRNADPIAACRFL